MPLAAAAPGAPFCWAERLMGRLAGGAGYWGRQKTSRDAPDALWHLLQLTGPLRSLSGGVHLPVVQGSKRAAQVDEGQSLAEVRALLDAPLQPNSQLVTGRLDNGLNYVILPNAVPPERFEAHLEIHAGARSARRPPSGPVPSVQPPPDMLHRGRALAAPLAIVSGPEPPPAGAASGAEVAGCRRLSALCAHCQVLPEHPQKHSEDRAATARRQRGRAAGPAGAGAPGGARHVPGQLPARAAAGHRRALQRVHRLPPHRVPRARAADQHVLAAGHADAAAGARARPPAGGAALQPQTLGGVWSSWGACCLAACARAAPDMRLFVDGACCGYPALLQRASLERVMKGPPCPAAQARPGRPRGRRAAGPGAPRLRPGW